MRAQTAAGTRVGATLGYAVALQGKQRVIACIGDGSFQVTAQARAPTCRPSYQCPVTWRMRLVRRMHSAVYSYCAPAIHLLVGCPNTLLIRTSSRDCLIPTMPWRSVTSAEMGSIAYNC